MSRKEYVGTVPEDAIEGFLKVRADGNTNMFDANTVWRYMSDSGHYEGCCWLVGEGTQIDTSRYMALIHAVEERLTKRAE